MTKPLGQKYALVLVLLLPSCKIALFLRKVKLFCCWIVFSIAYVIIKVVNIEVCSMSDYSIQGVLDLVKEKPISELSGDILIDFIGNSSILLSPANSSAAVVADSDVDNDSLGCKISISLDDFALLLSGDLDATSAYMQGRLQVAGDMGLAMELSSWM